MFTFFCQGYRSKKDTKKTTVFQNYDLFGHKNFVKDPIT